MPTMRFQPIWLLVWACTLWGAGSLPEALARPAQVILLRHGEKPADDEDMHLTDRGRQRAAALVDWFALNPKLTNNGVPVVLYATRITRHDHGIRASETLEPLARRLKLPIQTPYFAAEYRALAERVLTAPEYDGKTVVICWVHEFLPALALALGLKHEPPPWKGHVYDRAWVIRWPKDKAKLIDLPQHLLPGDSSR